MIRVTHTIVLDLECAHMPSRDAISAAQQRAEVAAARVYVNGDAGGKLTVEIEPSASPIEKTCEALNIRAGRMNVSRLNQKRKRARAAQPATTTE